MGGAGTDLFIPGGRYAVIEDLTGHENKIDLGPLGNALNAKFYAGYEVEPDAGSWVNDPIIRFTNGPDHQPYDVWFDHVIGETHGTANVTLDDPDHVVFSIELDNIDPQLVLTDADFMLLDPGVQ